MFFTIEWRLIETGLHMQEYFDHGILENQAKQLQVEVKYNGQ